MVINIRKKIIMGQMLGFNVRKYMREYNLYNLKIGIYNIYLYDLVRSIIYDIIDKWYYEKYKA